MRKKKNFFKRNLIKEFIILNTKSNLQKISLRAIDERVTRGVNSGKSLIDIFKEICINVDEYEKKIIPIIEEFIFRLNFIVNSINKFDLSGIKTRRGLRYLKMVLLKKFK